MKHNFLLPHKVNLKEAGLEIDVSYANAHVGAWLKDVAHQRVHGTTLVTPEFLLSEEVKQLQPLPVVQTIAEQPIVSPPYQPVHPNVIHGLQHPMSIYDEVLGL